MKKNARLWTIIGIILIGVLYSFILFAVKPELTLSQWIIYGFTLLSLLILLLAVSIPRGNVKENPMLDLIQGRIICIYCGLQIICGGILGMILPLPGEYVVLMIETAALAVFIIIAVLLNSKMSSIRSLDDTDFSHVSEMREMTAAARKIKAGLEEPELAEKAEKMVEVMQYADPAHMKETQSVEERINNNLRILSDDIEAGEMDNVSERMDMIIQMVQERTDIIRTYKK